MGIFKKGPLQSPRQAKKSFGRFVKEEVDDYRKKDDLSARRQKKQQGGEKK